MPDYFWAWNKPIVFLAGRDFRFFGIVHPAGGVGVLKVQSEKKNSTGNSVLADDPVKEA